jgi:hypothetical protein
VRQCPAAAGRPPVLQLVTPAPSQMLPSLCGRLGTRCWSATAMPDRCLLSGAAVAPLPSWSSSPAGGAVAGSSSHDHNHSARRAFAATSGGGSDEGMAELDQIDDDVAKMGGGGRARFSRFSGAPMGPAARRRQAGRTVGRTGLPGSSTGGRISDGSILSSSEGGVHNPSLAATAAGVATMTPDGCVCRIGTLQVKAVRCHSCRRQCTSRLMDRMAAAGAAG